MLPPLTRSDRWKLLAASCLSLLIALSLAKAGCFTVTSPVKQTLLKFDSQPSSIRQPPRWNDYLGGEWQLSDSAEILQAHRQGTFTISVPNEQPGCLIVHLFGQGGPAFHGVVSISEDGAHFSPIQQLTSLENELRLDLSADTEHLSRVWLRLSVSNEPSPGKDSNALLSRIRLFVALPDQTLINLPTFALAAFIPPVAYFALRNNRRPGAFLLSLLIQGGVLLLIWGTTRQGLISFSPAWVFDSIQHKRNLYLAIVYAVLIGMMAWRLASTPNAHGWQLTWESLALIGLLCLGAMNRLDALLFTSWDSLLPDALDYKQLAESLDSPFETGAREPLWIWIIAGWFELTEPSGLRLRVLFVEISIVLLVMNYLYVGSYSSKHTLYLLCTGLSPLT